MLYHRWCKNPCMMSPTCLFAPAWLVLLLIKSYFPLFVVFLFVIMASSSTTVSHDSWTCSLSSTSIKLNGKNYLLWSKSFQVFLDVHQKILHITYDPPDVKDPTYDDWFASDCRVISWLVNSIDKQISCGVLMLASTKKIQETLKSTYRHKKNISHVVEIYKQFFTLQQGDQCVQE